MNINVTLEPGFESLLNYIIDDYGYEILNLEGIGEQTDITRFSKQFYNKSSSNTANISVDANSNVKSLTVVAQQNESIKPFGRLDSLNLLWKYLNREHGQEYADRLVKQEILGDYYINDMSNIQLPYCYNFSMMDLLNKGLPFVDSIPSGPPKHLSSFVGQLIHFTSYASNHIMGAVGLADLLIVMSYFVKKEFEDNPLVPEDYIWRQVKQEIQSIIYSVNQPFRTGIQSGFYNVSVYDKSFLESLRPGYFFPDGTLFDIPLVEKLQDIYIDMMNSIMDIRPITFPVTTACFCVDNDRNILDEEFLEYIAKKNQRWGFINIYAGESSTLSSCCFSEDTKIEWKLGSFETVGSFKDAFEAKKASPNDTLYCKTYNNGKTEWAEADVIKIPAAEHKIYDIVLDSGEKITATNDHLFPIKEKSVSKGMIDGCVPVEKLIIGQHLISCASDSLIYKKIVDIQPADYKYGYVYCFQVKDKTNPYFLLGNGVYTHNCRLRSKKENKYLGYTNSFGSGSTQIGSFGVVTLNLPHLAFCSKGNKDNFIDLIKNHVLDIYSINDAKRKILSERINLGCLPLYTHGFMNLTKQYATVGIVGLYEALQILGYDILDEDGQQLCGEILNVINEMNEAADEKYGYAHNVEQTPSENSAIKLAQKDRYLGLNQNYDLYSNQFIPLAVTANMLDRITLQGMFDSQFSGGSIMHINCDSRVDDYRSIAEMIKATVKGGCVYHAINYNLQQCEDGHMSVGKDKYCHICSKPITDNYIRVVG